MKRLFISDLHLKSLDDPITRTFFDFLQRKALDADELYILGDFFEYWIGDDAGNQLSESVAEALSNLTATHKTTVFFMAGNRDFLLGHEYCQQADMTLIKEPYKLPGTRILLCHGDAECVSDTGYQQMRQVLRNPEWQKNFLSKPLQARIEFAEEARDQSREHQKDYMITDLDDEAVIALLNKHDADYLIHGHTHQPGIRPVAGSHCTRLTLSDWDREIWYASLDTGHPPELCPFK